MSEFRMVLLFEMHVIWNGMEYNMCVMIEWYYFVT